jgi:hypothetical protein
MNRFAWTEKGRTVHVTREYDETETRCGRVVVGEVDAGDVLWYETCQKCKASLGTQRERAG